MIKTTADLGIKTPLNLKCLERLIIMHSYTQIKPNIRKALKQLRLRPIVEKGRVLSHWMLDSDGNRVSITDNLSKQMQMMITEGEYPEVITPGDLVKIL